MGIDRQMLSTYIAADRASCGMTAYVRTLGALLDEDGPLAIPFFQRSFRWARAPHWIAFWEDWVSLSAVSGPRRVGYLGAIVVGARETASTPQPPRELLDGQQRLLLSCMALKAAELHCRRLGMLDETAMLSGLLTGYGAGPRVLASRPNVADFEAALALEEMPRALLAAGYRADEAALDDPEQDRAASPDEAEDLEAATAETSTPAAGAELGAEAGPAFGRLHRALAFFYLRLEAELKGDAPAPALQRMLRALLGRTRLVVIELGPEDDGLEVFEHLNGRGEPLSRLDLVKTALFKAIDQTQEPRDTRDRRDLRPSPHAVATYDRYWRDTFDSEERAPFWEREITRGAERRPMQDWLLRASLSADSGRAIGHRELLEEIRRRLGPDASAGAIDEIRRLSADGDAFAALHVRGRPDPRERQIERIRVFARFAVEPLLVSLRAHVWDDAEALPAVLGMLESCVVRRFFAADTTTDDYARYARLCVMATDPGRRRGAAFAAGFREALASHGRGKSFWKTDSEFSVAAVERDLVNRAGNRRAQERKQFFRAVYGCLDEIARGDAPASPELADPSLTIEHLFPLKGRAGWPSLRTRDARVLTTIGNLAMVDASLNRKMGERPWREKREMLAGGSTIFLNLQIVATPEWAESWDIAQIRDRGRRLVDLGVRRWPGPTWSGWPS